MKSLALVVLLSAATCKAPSPSPSPTPVPAPSGVTSPDAGTDSGAGADAGPAPQPDKYEKACAGLRASMCREGFHAECSHVLWLADKKHVFVVNATCLAACADPHCADACGDVRCTVVGTTL